MSFASLAEQQDSVQLLQRSLERGRLGHAYLFHGSELTELESVARTLAKTLACAQPVRAPGGKLRVDSCDRCLPCRKIEDENHPDILWIRPESKLRVIKIDQIRDLLQTVYLKPAEAEFKVAILVEADRLTTQAANAFLKTLEEPPADSILVLLSVEPQRILETILSRCLRLNISGQLARHVSAEMIGWLKAFADVVVNNPSSLLGRYQILSLILAKLGEIKSSTEELLTRRSPLESHDDIDPKLKDKWEDELSAAIEAEYRRKRAELLTGLQWWMRDLWLLSQDAGRDLLTYPDLTEAIQTIARRLTERDVAENLTILETLQRQLSSNVQEALALEVGLLRLRL